MSIVLYEFAKSFVNGRLSAEIFSEAYMELWKIERDSGLLTVDDPKLSECLSSIFCAADMYSEDDEFRRDYELNEEQLRDKICMLMKPLGFTGMK